MTKKEIQARQREIMNAMSDIETAAAKNEGGVMTPEQREQYNNLIGESAGLSARAKAMASEAELSKIRENEDKNVLFREYIKSVKMKRESNTVTLAAKGTPDGTSIEESGAIALTIKDLIDTKVEGIELPAEVQMLTGVVGDVLWPLSTDDAIASVAGEVEQIDEQALKFANQKASSERVAVAVAVSNKAIDNADFDLIGFVSYKIRKAIAIMFAKRVYSHAQWSDDFKGPFSLVTAGTINKGSDFAKSVATAVATIADLGFEGNPTIIIDKVTEAELKYTPANDFNGNTDAVIKDGKLAGYNYITSGHINGELDGEGDYVKSSDRYLGIGFFEYIALQQHGEVRFGIDNSSAAVQGRNSTVFTLNTDMSLTELSGKINGGDGTPQAFALYKIEDESSSDI